jgi:hypothetical protein
MTYKIVNELLTYCNSMHYTYGLSTDKFVTYTIYYARYLFRLDSSLNKVNKVSFEGWVMAIKVKKMVNKVCSSLEILFFVLQTE